MSEHTWFIVAIVMYMLAMLAIGVTARQANTTTTCWLAAALTPW